MFFHFPLFFFLFFVFHSSHKLICLVVYLQAFLSFTLLSFFFFLVSFHSVLLRHEQRAFITLSFRRSLFLFTTYTLSLSVCISFFSFSHKTAVALPSQHFSKRNTQRQPTRNQVSHHADAEGEEPRVADGARGECADPWSRGGLRRGAARPPQLRRQDSRDGR